MAEREQRRRGAPRSEEPEVDEAATNETGQELKAELDDLLDEIDDVLETNAEEFVKNYVQKGGE
ncbi:MAG: ubiquitin-like protein Pup [Actinomycetota bacterium]|nr:ubiquitin-like protein Pup [Acidimicrobiales bacterium]MEC8922962.1 ubiquitin-like protein Pup [Actinomycetota bacterium]MED5551946.1 ubiquitin-like protein Pup [Actinomycetota bacterium]MEE3187587.1 ubiquitin-like protein Pup [Actinomycetota bacterium]